MITIGFTGTRHGMSDYQKNVLADEVSQYMLIHRDNITCVHGGCIGADEEFHKLAKNSKLRIEVRPGHYKNDPSRTDMQFDFSDADVIHPSKPFHERNRNIVEQCDVLLATPYSDVRLGGTWYTIGYAKETKKQCIRIDRNSPQKAEL